MTFNEAAWGKRYRLDREHGITRLVDATPASDHIRQLLAAGATQNALAELASVGDGTISALAGGRRAKCKRTTAAAVLNITLADTYTRPNPRGFVTRIGFNRRIRALQAIGWPLHELSRRSGIPITVKLFQNGPWVSTTTHHAIANLYNQLSMTHGPSQLTRNRAALAGWPPPLAWDDDAIDDPTAQPQHQAIDVPGSGVDEAAVLRRAGGDSRVPLRRPERWAVVSRLHATGMSDPDIARRAGIHVRQVLRDRQALGLAANSDIGRADVA